MVRRAIIILIIFLGLGFFPFNATAKKPPWAHGNNPPPPPTAPEPLALTLAGMGISACVGYYLGQKKKK
jgi:hypothetical protein